jgi:hypothetical protein
MFRIYYCSDFSVVRKSVSMFLNFECRIYDQLLTCYVETHTDDPHRVNLERRMFDRILYVVDKSDMPR